MTHIFIPAPRQTPRFNGTIASLIMVATVTITGFLSVAMFAG